MTEEQVSLGADYLAHGRCRFCLWAPLARRVQVRLVSPEQRLIALAAVGRGYHLAVAEGVEPGSLYFYRLDEAKERPDPASRFQPQGVHGPSQVVDPHFPWEDSCWFGLPLADYIIYELHVGTFTPAGTFAAVLGHLKELKQLGITAVELMPVGQFPGERNWGYDGTYPFAPQNSYGGPEGLKRLVNGCHQLGLAVVLDVVYNHLGPEGNYLGDFGPYFTERYRSAWGWALNFDGAHSDEVRRFFIGNALYWLREFHVDALRLDAVHGILDFSARPFLQELAEAVHREAERLNRRVHLIAESDLNDPRLVRGPELGGFGLDAQWNDDFHHALHRLLTGEDGGYYQDFGRLEHLARAMAEGFVYSGQYSAYRQRRHGSSSRQLPASRLVVFAQNHDQVGNRARGERLSQLASSAALKLAAAAVLLSPFVPLLFMGEEYGEPAPFHYFTSHSDPALAQAVRRGRQQEFAAFRWQGEPADPQQEETFLASRLDQARRHKGEHRLLFRFYQELIKLRKDLPALRESGKDELEVVALEQRKVLLLRRWHGLHQAAAIFNFAREEQTVRLFLSAGNWGKRLDSAEPCWHGPGSSLPAQLTGGGRVSLRLPPETVAVFVSEAEPAGAPQ